MMRNIQQIEKFFSRVGVISNITVTVILMLILGHYLIGFVAYISDYLQDFLQGKASKEIATQSFISDPRENLPVYNDYHDKIELWKEHSKKLNYHFEPYYHWRSDGFFGKYMTVSPDGVRRTVKTDKNVEGKKKTFMFGGSTLWGTGSKDEHTIPSFLQSMLGKNYDIYNYGQSGYVSTQELNYLLYQLAIGNIPDIVIFYDGANDGYAGAYSPAIPRDPHIARMKHKNDRRKIESNLFVTLFNSSNYKKLAEFIIKRKAIYDEWDSKVKLEIPKNSESVVKMYESHIKQVKALAKEYNFKAFFFWQPNLFSGTKNMLPYEAKIVKNSSPVLVESQRQVYLKAKKRFNNREAENIYFLGDIFNEIREPVYIDWCHLGPDSNGKVAEKIYGYIKDIL